MIVQWTSGFLGGLAIGTAIFSPYTFARGVLVGLIAGAFIGAMMVDGVDGYVRWLGYLPAEMARFSAFWISLFIGLIVGARLWRSK